MKLMDDENRNERGAPVITAEVGATKLIPSSSRLFMVGRLEMEQASVTWVEIEMCRKEQIKDQILSAESVYFQICIF